MINLVKYIGSQFANPRGFWGKMSTYFMNRLNKKQYKSVVKLFREIHPQNVLDIGFGNGYLLEKLSYKCNSNFYGIEMSKSMVEYATKRNNAVVDNHQMQLSLGDVVNMEFKDSTFDFIYTVNTVYFWSNFDQGYSEVYRTLKPGGAFANVFYTKKRLDKLKYTQYDFKKFTKDEMLDNVKKMSYSKVELIEIKKDYAYCLVAWK